MSIALITTLMFLTLFLSMALGLPVAFGLGGTAILFALLLTPRTLLAAPMTLFTTPWQPILMTIPMFVFMGSLIRYSGIAEAAYDMMYKLLGTVSGGLAIGTLVICTLFAGITGIVPPATITMGLIAIPSMLKYKYDKRIAVGSVAAGGALGDLIPPSGGMIFYAILAKVSLASLFMGGIMPGLLLVTLYILYIGIRSKLNPKLAPPIPPEEKVSWSEKIKVTPALLPFLFLIFGVLGVIWLGVATPTEAATFGAVGALLITAIYRRLSWRVLKESLTTTVELTLMGVWILVGANLFINVFSALGAQSLLTESVLAMPGGKWGIIAMMMVSVMMLGMVMDDWAIINLLTPLYVPIITDLGINKLWFGIILITNIQMAFLTPPYGFVLFMLKGVLPKGITMGDVYRSIIPFVILQMIGLSLVIIFPPIATWLPSTMK